MKTLIKIQKEIDKTKKQILVLESYLDAKRVDRDWHGVWDASMDLKNLDDRLSILEGIKVELLTEVAAKQQGETQKDVQKSSC